MMVTSRDATMLHAVSVNGTWTPLDVTRKRSDQLLLLPLLGTAGVVIDKNPLDVESPTINVTLPDPSPSSTNDATADALLRMLNVAGPTTTPSLSTIADNVDALV